MGYSDCDLGRGIRKECNMPSDDERRERHSEFLRHSEIMVSRKSSAIVASHVLLTRHRQQFEAAVKVPLQVSFLY